MAQWLSSSRARWIPGVTMLSCAAGASAVELTGYGVLTTDYVFRGVSYSNGNPAAQLGGDASFDSGVYFGIWASTIDIYNRSGNQRDLEIDYYVGYQKGVTDKWNLGARVVVYTFPGATGDVDYDYSEVALTVNFQDRAWLEYAYSPDLYNTGYDSHNLEVFAEWPIPANLVLGAGAGYYDVSKLAGDGYAYWELGVTRPIGRFDIDLRYHDTSKAVRIISTPERADARLVLSGRVSF